MKCPGFNGRASLSRSVTFWGRLRCDRGSVFLFFFSSRRRHTRCSRDWSSDVCSSDLRHTRVSGHEAREWSIESDIGGGLSYVRAIGIELGMPPQAVAVESDVPPGSGLSSSAALLVAIAAGLHPELDGKEAGLACQRAEKQATGVHVGVMDQFAAALGRRGNALLLDCSTLDYQTVPFPDELVIAVIDSGEHRSLAETPYNERRREAESGHPKRRRHFESEIARVHAFV